MEINLGNDGLKNILTMLQRKSTSQFLQDFFVLQQTGFKSNGYFVEFGATNGVRWSNTHLLEKEFHWQGIIAEPAKCWHAEILKNRNCNIDFRCVWKESGETLIFNEARDPDLSTIDAFSSADLWADQRGDGTRYPVKTVSLMDLLASYRAPREIDYLSIDTEGSELEILLAFDFDRYDIRIITCEHNQSAMRDGIYTLLRSRGYERTDQSESPYEDWFVRR